MAREKIIKAGMAYTICNVILRGISFLTVPIFVRLLTTEEFGRYNIFVSFEGILFIFSALTVHVSIKNAKYDFHDRYNTYVQNCIYLDFFNSLLLGLVANIVCFFWSSIIDLNYLEVNLLVLSGFCQAVIAIYSTKIIMEYKSGKFVLISFVSVIVGIASSLLLIFTICDTDRYIGRVIGGVLGQVIATIIILIDVYKGKVEKVDINLWKYGIKISAPIIPHGLSQIALSSANRIMIKYIYNASLAGIYSFTYTVSLIPQILFNSISNVWEPWFFENRNSQNFSRIRSITRQFCCVISLAFIAMSSVVPEFVKIFATSDYYEAIDISIIVLIGCYFATLYYIPCEVEYFHKKTIYIAISTFLAAVLNIGLNYLMMKYLGYGYKIAAYISLLTYALYFSFHLIIALRIERGNGIFDIKSMILVILASTIIMTLNVFLIEFLFYRLLITLFVLFIYSYFNKALLIRIVKYARNKITHGYN